MGTKQTIRFEDAHPKPIPTIDYQCCQCDRVWHDERSARGCCADSAPCMCGGRMPTYHVMCDNCLEVRAEKDWNLQEFCQWDGLFPVASNRHERFYWCAEELREAIIDAMETELDMDGEEVSLGAVEAFCFTRRIGECVKEGIPAFDVDYFLQDHLLDGDVVPGGSEINEQVDRLIQDAGIQPVYYPNGGRIDPRQIAAILGVSTETAE